MGRWTGRITNRALVVALATIGVLSLSFAGVGLGAAVAADADGDAFVSAINSSRASLAGVEGLAPAADLIAIAERHAAAMAARGSIYHNPDLGRQVQDWEVVGENVGVGPDVASLHQAFLDSPAHRANVLDARYRQVGIG
ncbi:MAG: CAP domain-containing protein, partial [Actinomycetota bacterium]|nr:CAP domain-containing protein [Actinomycetota bacterium]